MPHQQYTPPRCLPYADILGLYLVAALSNSALFSSRSTRKWCWGSAAFNFLFPRGQHVDSTPLRPRHRNLLRELLGILARNRRQHQKVSNGFGIACVLGQSLVQRCLCLLCTSKVQLSNSLRDESCNGRRCRRLRKLLEHVESLLILISALYFLSLVLSYVV